MNMKRTFAAVALMATAACGAATVAEKVENLPAGAVRLKGAMGEALAKTTANRLKKIEWTKLVDVFRFRDERDGCWRSEFWGKIVRSAIHAWRATGDAELKAQITATVKDLISTQTPEGCISSYPAEFQTRRWDVWGRKYVLLGLVRYYEVVERDEEVKTAAMKLLDHLMTQVGPGARDVIQVGEQTGMPASSVLGAVMGVYRISGEKRYLDYARWIVSRGCSTNGNVFEAARAGVPAQFIGNGKAYEMTSCFQGFGDFVRADGTADDVALLGKYFRNVRDTEIFVTGTGGGKDMGGEFWYGGANLQTKDVGEIRMGETCITTEWIRYMDNVYRLTLDPAIADELERTFYNALLGAMTPDGSSFTHGNPNPLGKSLGELAHGYHSGWSYKAAAGDQIPGFGEDCCLAQGPEGIAMAPLSAVMKTADGLVLNAYEALEADYAIGGEKATLKVEGGFPFADGAVSVTGFAAGEWTLKLRIPYYWNCTCSLKLNGEDVKGTKAGSYLDLRRDWKPGDRLEIAFDLSPREQISPDRSSRALLSGPLVLASDSRFTRTRTVDVVPGTGWVREPDALGEMRSVWRDSRGTRLTDYASAGNRFRHDNRLRVWFDRVEPAPYTAKLGGKPLPLESARISALPFNRVWPGYQRSLDQTKTAKFVQIDLSAPTALELRFPKGRPSAPTILPLSRRGKVACSDGAMTIALERPEQFIVDFGDEAEPLHVFVNEPWTYEAKPGDIYFGPGEHDAGVIAPKSGQRVVLDHGAVVYGAIFAYKADGVTVTGRGVLDSSRMGRQDKGARAYRKSLGLNEFDTEFACGAFTVYTCNDFRMDGIVIRDTPFWSLIVRNGCRGVDIRNVKVIGQWRYNSDGFDICASEDVTIRDSFLRTFDDCVVARGPYLDGETTPVRNMLVENCNLWCDWGKNMEVWAGHLPALIENVTYRGNRLLNVAHYPADVTTWYGSTNTVIRNVTFEDIEMDLLPNRPKEVFQRGDDQVFVSRPWTSQALFEISVQRPARNLDNQQTSYEGDFSAYRAAYDNIVLKDFRVYGDLLPMTALVMTAHPGHSVKGVKVVDMPEFALTKEGNVEVAVERPRAYLKVGTSNVKCPAPWDKTVENHWTYRSPFLFEQWRAQNPDVIGMQEPVAEYVDAIAAAFPEWDHVGIGREGGAKGEFGPIFWRKDRFDLLKDGTFWLSGRPEEVGSVYPGANHPRICTFAYLKDRRTGKTVAFYNTHTSYVSEKICSAQIAMIAAHMKANAPKGAVRILTGDLNFEAGGAALKPAFDAGLVNADNVCTGPLSGLWNSVTLYRLFPKSAPAEAVRQFLAQHGGDLKAARAAFGDLGSRIDHILVSPDVKVTACGVDDSNRGGWYPSDHMPKFAVIEL